MKSARNILILPHLPPSLSLSPFSYFPSLIPPSTVPPVITNISTSDAYALLNTTVTLTCIAVGSPPLNYTWSLNNMVVSTGGGVFTWPLLQTSQFGTYSCNVYNEFGEAEQQVTIEQAGKRKMSSKLCIGTRVGRKKVNLLPNLNNFSINLDFNILYYFNFICVFCQILLT